MNNHEPFTTTRGIINDLLESKHTLGMVRQWVYENAVELKTLGLLESINRLIYKNVTEES